MRRQNRVRIWILNLVCLAVALPVTASDDVLGLGDQIRRNDIIILGWAHFPAPNDVIPALVKEQLEMMSKFRTTILIERSSTTTRDALLYEFREIDRGNSPLFVSLREESSVFRTAYALNIEVLGGDLAEPHPFPGDIEKNIPFRDQAFAENAKIQLAEGKQKVLIWVGDRHVEGISQNLQKSGYKVGSIRTDWNPKTKEVHTFEGKVLGTTRGLGFSELYPTEEPSPHRNLGIFARIRRMCSELLRSFKP